MSQTATAVIEQKHTQARTDSFYRPGLDILRVLAFLLVFVAHGLAWYVDKPTQIGAIARAGEFGVCVFFFLSSYLITELLLQEKRDTGTILIPAFYVRRILRIWPLYFAMIVVISMRAARSRQHRFHCLGCLALTVVRQLVHGRTRLSTRIPFSALELLPLPGESLLALQAALYGRSIGSGVKWLI